MPTEVYHKTKQNERIAKRLALHDCFNAYLTGHFKNANLVYITFGGEDLVDILDFILCALCRTGNYSLKVFSYEEDLDVFQKSKNSSIYKTFNGNPRVTINIINSSFPDDISLLKRNRETSNFIYHLDYTGVYKERQLNTIEYLYEKRMLKKNDGLLITSAFAERVLRGRMKTRLKKYKVGIGFFYKKESVSDEFVENNYIEYLIIRSIYEIVSHYKHLDGYEDFKCTMLKKIRYQDTKTKMLLHSFRFEDFENRNKHLEVKEFTTYPHEALGALKRKTNIFLNS
jgi:hypothetical protein